MVANICDFSFPSAIGVWSSTNLSTCCLANYLFINFLYVRLLSCQFGQQKFNQRYFYQQHFSILLISKLTFRQLHVLQRKFHQIVVCPDTTSSTYTLIYYNFVNILFPCTKLCSNFLCSIAAWLNIFLI